MSDGPTTVVAFRLPEKSASALHDRAVRDRIMNIRSGNQLARKLVLDFLAGKLMYVSPVDKRRDPMLYGS